MELKFRAETIARLEDSDMLGTNPMSLFFGSVTDVDEDTVKTRAMQVFMSVKTLVTIISAGYDNDIKKAYKVFEEEIKNGKTQFDIGGEVFEELQKSGYLGGSVEKKVLEDSIPSEKSGKKEK